VTRFDELHGVSSLTGDGDPCQDHMGTTSTSWMTKTVRLDSEPNSQSPSAFDQWQLNHAFSEGNNTFNHSQNNISVTTRNGYFLAWTNFFLSARRSITIDGYLSPLSELILPFVVLELPITLWWGAISRMNSLENLPWFRRLQPGWTWTILADMGGFIQYPGITGFRASCGFVYATAFDLIFLSLCVTTSCVGTMTAMGSLDVILVDWPNKPCWGLGVLQYSCESTAGSYKIYPKRHIL